MWTSAPPFRAPVYYSARGRLASLVYRMLKYKMPYHEIFAAEYDRRQHTRVLPRLRKRATHSELRPLIVATATTATAE